MRRLAAIVAILLSVCGGLAVASPTPPVSATAETVAFITLSDIHPSGSFPLSAGTIAAVPAILRLSVIKVDNAAATPVVIYVNVVVQAGGAESPSNYQAAVGNFSLYPPDHPAGFALDATNAFRALRPHLAAQSGSARLVLEMRRLNPKRPWTPVALTIAPPEW
jgi:hypothetical protein